MRRKIPTPVSGGLVLSYRCTSRCRHCIYACGPDRSADWISREDLERVLASLAGKIRPAFGGPENVDLNLGLHFTGGEPFADFELLLSAVAIGERLEIPSTFVETNGFWATGNETAREMLRALKAKGLKGIMISVNPFYLESVPFERTERAIEASLEVFGSNTMVYQIEHYRRFKRFGFAEDRGYAERPEGYFSRCHLCTDMRRHLAATGSFRELQPVEFYRHLDG